MRSARFTLVTLFSLLLGTGLICAQICDVECVYQESRPSAAVPKAEDNQHAHCHQEGGPASAPEKPDHSGCVSHSGMTALASTSQAWVSVEQGYLAPAYLALLPTFGFTLDHLVGLSNSNLPFRSPPHYPKHSVLRI
jgi:hypothetical protein